ncbi:MAG: hypothetical protein NT023_12505 [Armatimonadetes bacterium]|nr:hypothetical protein [Armatimonadota bacterium]
MSDFILDTDVMIDLLRLQPFATSWLQSLPDFPAVSCFTALELLGGSRDKQEYRTVEKFLLKFTILYPLQPTWRRASIATRLFVYRTA